MSSSKRVNEFDHAFALARRYLRFGTRSTAQLRTHLTARQVATPVAEAVLAACHRQGFLDDWACAKLWVTTLAERGYARAAIHEHLRAKGLDEAILEPLLTPRGPSDEDAARARAVVHARLAHQGRGRSDSAHRRRDRLARLLASRGFDSDLIERILAESLGPPA